MSDWADKAALELSGELDFDGERDDKEPPRSLARLATALRAAEQRGAERAFADLTFVQRKQIELAVQYEVNDQHGGDIGVERLIPIVWRHSLAALTAKPTEDSGR